MPQDNSYDPFAAEKQESPLNPLLASWIKQAAGKDVDTVKAIGQGIMDTLMLPERLGQAVQESNFNTFGPGPQTMNTDELPFKYRDRSPILSAEAAMNVMGGAGIVPREANALRSGIGIPKKFPTEPQLSDLDTIFSTANKPKQSFSYSKGEAKGKFQQAKEDSWEMLKKGIAAAKSVKSSPTLIDSIGGKVKDAVTAQAAKDATEEAMKAIEKALNDPPHMEISSPITPRMDSVQETIFDSLGEFPKVVPFKPPEKAISQGYTTPAVHGTRMAEWRWETPPGGGMGQPGDALKLPPDELGVHFGTPEQAHHFTGTSLRDTASPRTYPTVLKTGKSLELPDMGSWQVDRIKEALNGLNTGKGYGIDRNTSVGSTVSDPLAHVGKFPPEEINSIKSIQEMREYLHNKGYDSINYINTVEGPGQRSYIMFKPSEERGFVSGVRSPFAAFDPSKMSRPDLAAGIAGTLGAAGAGAAAMTPTESKANPVDKKKGDGNEAPVMSPGVAKFVMEFLKANPDLAKEMSTRMQAVINGQQIQGQQKPQMPQGPVNGP